MKFIFSIIFILVFCFEIKANNYVVGDTLNVFAKSGLKLRSKPSLNGDSILKLGFGQKVIIENSSSKIDTIDCRIGSWVFVKTLKKESGYVFDAYISDMPIPTIKQIEKNNFAEYIKSNFKENSCEITVIIPEMGEKKATEEKFKKYENGITRREVTGWEWRDEEYIFEKRRLGELITIAELFFSSYPKTKANFNTTLCKAFKKNPNKIQIMITENGFFIMIKNGVFTKSILIGETYG